MTSLLISGISVAVVGVAVAFLSIPFFIREKTLKKNCTASTTGHVIGYVYRGGDNGGSVAPKVEFSVEGQTYRAYRHYKGIISVHKRGAAIKDASELEGDFHITEKDMFYVHTAGAVGNYKRMGERAWPIGTTLPVVYNPAKPRQAFVEKVVSIANIAGIVLLSAGGGLALIGGIVVLIAL